MNSNFNFKHHYISQPLYKQNQKLVMLGSMVQTCKAVGMIPAFVQKQNKLDKRECLWRTRPGLLSSGLVELFWHSFNGSDLQLVHLSSTVRSHLLVFRHLNNTSNKFVGSPQSIYISLKPLSELIFCFMKENIWLQ